MARAAALLELLGQIGQRRRAFNIAAGNRICDARQVLHHDAAGADIEMSDLGIAHLAVRQADVLAGSVQECVRPVLPQPVEGRRLGLTDGVVGCLLAPAPAVENNEHDRPPTLHLLYPSLWMITPYCELRRTRQSKALRHTLHLS